jgi:hypothetical protein
VPGIGILPPVLYDLLELAGYNLDPTKYDYDQDHPGTGMIPDEDRIAIMERGRESLIQRTGEDFGFSLVAWLDYLEAHADLGDLDRQDAAITRDLVVRALDDSERQRLLEHVVEH